MDKLMIEEVEHFNKWVSDGWTLTPNLRPKIEQMAKQLADTMRRETRLREELESVANCAYLGEGGCAKELLSELYPNKHTENGLPQSLADQVGNACPSHGPKFINIECTACMKAVEDFQTKTKE